MSATHQAAFSRVYASTRSQLSNGDLLPGTQLLVGEWASLHGVSATPVREAFAKLAGEGLIEDRERLGFFVPLPSSVELVALIDLLELYLMRAIHCGRREGAEAAERYVEADMQGDAGVLLTLAGHARNPFLTQEVQRCLDRSAHARKLEVELFGPATELPVIADALARSDWVGLAALVRKLSRLGRARAGAIAHSLASSYRETIVRK